MTSLVDCETTPGQQQAKMPILLHLKQVMEQVEEEEEEEEEETVTVIAATGVIVTWTAI